MREKEREGMRDWFGLLQGPLLQVQTASTSLRNRVPEKRANERTRKRGGEERGALSVIRFAGALPSAI